MKGELVNTKSATKVLAILLMLFLVLPKVGAAEHVNFSQLSQQQLDGQITALQKRLKQNTTEFNTIKSLGVAYHFKATADARQFAAKSVALLDKARSIKPKDYEVLIYLGSATTMRAQAVWNPLKKMSFANKGIAMMDKAVRKAPDNITVRMTRAISSMKMPDILKRKGVALQDYEYLAQRIETDPVTYASIRKKVYIDLASLYAQEDKPEMAAKYRRMAQNQ